MKNTHIILSLFCATFVSCKHTVAISEPTTKPNILFIAIDDLRAELGSYGGLAISPNMDEIANTGSLFLNHYVQVPTCGASRYALLTGKRPTKRIHLSNRAIEKELSNQMEDTIPETFIHQLKQQGYHTVGIGKISHSADGLLYGYEDQPSITRELPHSWTELLFDPGKWGTGWNAFFAYSDGENRQSLKKQVKPYELGVVGDEGYPDALTAKLAISKLRELKTKQKPFFMGVGFFKPHLPFNAPKKYWDMYDTVNIPLAPNREIPENINRNNLHESGEFNQYALGEEKASLTRPLSNSYAKKIRHAYLASVSYIDALVGKIMEELKATGLDKNTVVVIWGDHGWHLGDQRVWGKHTLYESALKSTLIVKSPYMEHRVKKVKNIVETVDIYPTIMEICGITSKTMTDGESLARIMEISTANYNNNAFSYYKNGISLRYENYRLTKYFASQKPRLELYDLAKDPWETKNIASENKHVIKHLMPLLEKGNKGLFNSTQ